MLAILRTLVLIPALLALIAAELVLRLLVMDALFALMAATTEVRLVAG